MIIDISYFNSENKKVTYYYELDDSDKLINYIENIFPEELDKAVFNDYCWIEAIIDPTYGIETEGKFEELPIKLKVKNTEENFNKIKNSPWIKTYKKIIIGDEEKELKDFEEKCSVNFKEINDVVNITCVIVTSMSKNEFIRKHFIDNNYYFTDDMFAHFSSRKEQPPLLSYDTVKNILLSLSQGNGKKEWLRRLKKELKEEFKSGSYEMNAQVVITNMYNK